MNAPLLDLVPRTKRMIDRPGVVDQVVALSVVVGLVDGLALSLLLPAITALADDRAVWGLGVTGWLWVLGLLAVVNACATYFQIRRGFVIGGDFIRNVHRRIGDQVARMPLGWFSSGTVGRLSRMVSSQLTLAGQILAHMLAPLVASLTASVVVVVCAWFWNWRLGLVLTVAAPVFLAFLFVSTALMRHGKRIAEGPEVELANRIVEFARCQGALRSAGRSTDFAPLGDAVDHAYQVKRRQLWFEMFGNLAGGAVGQSVIVVLMVVAGELVLSGGLAPIPAIAFIGLCLRFTTMLTTITETAMGLEDRRPLLDTFDEVLTAPVLPEPVESALRHAPGTVVFDGVDFSYRTGVPVLRDVGFSVPAKTMVALVGPSGCGKTTALRLIGRFHEADSGSIRVGGAHVADQRTEDLMAQISLVFQDVYLFDDTLIENIRVGRADATREEIEHAAELAGVTEIVERLPSGWDTAVGEGGRALSGGERQRVSVARAILKGAPIVLLDEATSSLDPENEDHIIEAVEHLRQHATLVVIAHKLRTIESADCIVQFTADGRVEDVGTHAELLARDGTYSRFWELRRRAQGWRLGAGRHRDTESPVGRGGPVP